MLPSLILVSSTTLSSTSSFYFGALGSKIVRSIFKEEIFMAIISRSILNLDFLMAIKGAINLFRDPTKTASVYDIEDGLRHTKATQLALEFVKSDPAVAQIIAQRYTPPPLDLDALLALPTDSLGYSYAAYIKESNFDPNFYRNIEVKDDISYVMLRLRQTHDLWHIVGGFSTDVAGELGLKSFELAQTHRTMSLILLTGGLLSTLTKSPADLDKILECVALGYRSGAKAKPLLAQKWEEQWSKSLSDWRQELGIEIATVYIP
jgi:ubiquinone biosynthesis protein COQ4